MLMEVGRIVPFGHRQGWSIYEVHAVVFRCNVEEFFRASMTYPGIEIST